MSDFDYLNHRIHFLGQFFEESDIFVIAAFQRLWEFPMITLVNLVKIQRQKN